MRIAFESGFRKMNKGNISAMFIYSIPPQLSHSKRSSPLLLTGIFCRLVRYVITVVNNDWNFC